MSERIYGGYTLNGQYVSDMVNQNHDFVTPHDSGEWFIRLSGKYESDKKEGKVKPALVLFHRDAPFVPLYAQLLPGEFSDYTDGYGGFTEEMKKRTNKFLKTLEKGHLYDIIKIARSYLDFEPDSSFEATDSQDYSMAGIVEYNGKEYNVELYFLTPIDYAYQIAEQIYMQDEDQKKKNFSVSEKDDICFNVLVTVDAHKTDCPDAKKRAREAFITDTAYKKQIIASLKKLGVIDEYANLFWQKDPADIFDKYITVDESSARYVQGIADAKMNRIISRVYSIRCAFNIKKYIKIMDQGETDAEIPDTRKYYIDKYQNALGKAIESAKNRGIQNFEAEGSIEWDKNATQKESAGFYLYNFEDNAYIRWMEALENVKELSDSDKEISFILKHVLNIKDKEYYIYLYNRKIDKLIEHWKLEYAGTDGDVEEAVWDSFEDEATPRRSCRILHRHLWR